MLQLNKINAGYGGLPVLWDIDLKVGEGQSLAVVGSNGSGKSTLMRTICGLIKPASGTITLDNNDVTKLTAHQMSELGIVYVPEGRRLFGRLSVMDNLLLGSYLKQNRKNRKENLDYVFGTFPILSERRNQKAGTLSGGEQQMLAIGRGLMSNPRMLLLDEPSLGIAPVIVDKIFDVIKLLQSREMTIIISEQNVKRALEIAEMGIVIQSGRIVLSGRSSDLIKSDEVRKAYLGL